MCGRYSSGELRLLKSDLFGSGQQGRWLERWQFNESSGVEVTGSGELAVELAACGESIRNTGVLVKPVGRPSQQGADHLEDKANVMWAQCHGSQSLLKKARGTCYKVHLFLSLC